MTTRYYSDIATVTTIQNGPGLTTSTTSLVVGDTTGFPTQMPFVLRLDSGTVNEELALVTSGSGTIGTPYIITRAFGNTTPKVHAFGALVSHGVCSTDFSDSRTHENDVATYHGTGAVTLTDASTIATNISLGSVFDLTLTASGHTIDTPSNPVNGKTIIYRIRQDATGSRTVLWHSIFRFSGSIPPILQTTPTTTDYVAVRYNATDSKWDATMAPGRVVSAGAVAAAVFALTDGATINTDTSLGNEFTVTLAGNRTIAAPTNPIDGQIITYRIKQDGTGSRTLTWNSIFRFTQPFPQPVLKTTASSIDYVRFIYNSTDTKWDCISVSNNLTVTTVAATAITATSLAATASVVAGVFGLTDGATINTDASLGNEFTVTLGGNRTIAAPTNPTNGQVIYFRIKQDGTGSRTLTWDAIFRFSAFSQPVLQTAASSVDYVGFIYNSTDTKWDCVASSGINQQMQTVFKASDQTVTNSGTLVDCTDLAFTAVAAGKYVFKFVVWFLAATTVDMAFGFTFPTGDMRITPFSIPGGGTDGGWHSLSNLATATTSLTGFTAEGNASDATVLIEGIFVATSAGSVQFRFANGTAGVGNTTKVYKYSYIDAKRVS